jgi:hypothetical protein
VQEIFMPINKVSREAEVEKKFKWNKDDKFVVANWQNNTTIAHFVGDELYEIIGTENDPVTYAELRKYDVDVDSFYMAGQLGVFRDGQYVFYKDTYEQYDDTYYDEPLGMRGFSTQNGTLATDNRQHNVYDEKPIVVNPNAVAEVSPVDNIRGKYAADNNS